jgi:hypothetical protein
VGNGITNREEWREADPGGAGRADGAQCHLHRLRRVAGGSHGRTERPSSCCLEPGLGLSSLVFCKIRAADSILQLTLTVPLQAEILQAQS